MFSIVGLVFNSDTIIRLSSDLISLFIHTQNINLLHEDFRFRMNYHALVMCEYCLVKFSHIHSSSHFKTHALLTAVGLKVYRYIYVCNSGLHNIVLLQVVCFCFLLSFMMLCSLMSLCCLCYLRPMSQH